MRHAIICSLLLLSACHKEEPAIIIALEPVKYHIGQKLMVVDDKFYSGCYGIAFDMVWCYSKDGKTAQPKYELLNPVCPGIGKMGYLRVAQDNLKAIK